MSEIIVFKTAKETCEDIKLNQKIQFDKQLNYFIKLVADNGGKYTSPYYKWNNTIDSKYVIKLQELGYKYEELKWQSTNSEKVIVYSNWVFKLIGLPDHIKYVESPGKEYTYFTISACCGEEEKNDA